MGLTLALFVLGARTANDANNAAAMNNFTLFADLLN